MLGTCGLPRLGFDGSGGVAHAAESPVIAQLRRIDASLRTSRYRHATRVDVARGRYEFDCSGMVNWVLARSAPVAWRTMSARARRPRARDYRRVLSGLSRGSRARGWEPVLRVADARPGDVVAWESGEPWSMGNTGHVVIVVERPEAYVWPRDTYRVRIADSTGFGHSDDTRLADGRTGFGYGSILLVVDPTTGMPRAMGWWGDLPLVSVEAPIAIGRPVR